MDIPVSLTLSLLHNASQEIHYVLSGFWYPAVSFSLASIWNWVKKDTVAANVTISQLEESEEKRTMKRTFWLITISGTLEPPC